ncbi:uncharacterized protein LOC117204430 isoform X1 [Bombus bifarius]|uniref:Uncharacterized protein LOC117204430 isoform X1 n=2 Tax=Bombus bifarius TaxID=103933 RepID=A0A6P8LCA5_9HYME|nr:uncharacterized protein LOC117153657 isoform X1 [Bombus vancouverensis nearcticus]XP_033297716.1 uncharacterized protein LOC117204430 isoform X1 [Bombus bifarius]XP_033297717.1 uncharacterized protein LOC117204430 isoform X1 [Bombus bifarius]
MPCSAVTLSLATITGIIATGLLAIAFSTDNWLYTEVKRAQIQQYAAKHAEQSHLVVKMNTKYYYYTRTQGLFRICYPKERPPTVQTYLSPVETHCMNINYFIPDEENLTRGFSDDAMTRLHMGRSVIALFIVGFVAIFTAFWTGVVGCWKRSPGNITATAILMLLACLLSASAMGLWHGVEYYEKEKIVGEEYYQQWSNQLYHTSKLNQFISNFTELQTQIQTNQLIKRSIKGFDKKIHEQLDIGSLCWFQIKNSLQPYFTIRSIDPNGQKAPRIRKSGTRKRRRVFEEETRLFTK